MAVIIPTIFAYDKDGFSERLARLLPIAQEFQIDFMDGALDTPKGVMPADIDVLPQKKRFEAHMMVSEPHRYVDLAAEKGFSRYLFHMESQHSKVQTRLLLERIKERGMQAGIVLNPSTPIARLEPFVKDLDVAMLMGHEPGAEGVGVDRGVYAKLKALHKKHPRLSLEVDGGVSLENAKKLSAAGATRLSVGSAISSSDDPRDALRALRGVLRR